MDYHQEREELQALREHLREAATIAGRLSEAVSDQRIPVELASEVAATRNVIIGAQSCAAVLARQLEERAKAGK
jgi:hypothetical protein